MNNEDSNKQSTNPVHGQRHVMLDSPSEAKAKAVLIDMMRRGCSAQEVATYYRGYLNQHRHEFLPCLEQALVDLKMIPPK